MRKEGSSSRCGSLWDHLPLLLRSSSKESLDYILQALWRTRNTGLDATDRETIRGILDLASDSDLDPLLVCLRMLIRRCVYENIAKDDFQKLFPQEVLPELQRLLTLLLQKFQREWREDILKDKNQEKKMKRHMSNLVSVPDLKEMMWDKGDHNSDSSDQVAVIKLKLQEDTKSLHGDTEVKFQLAKDTLETMLKSLYFIRDQMSNVDDTPNGEGQAQEVGRT